MWRDISRTKLSRGDPKAYSSEKTWDSLTRILDTYKYLRVSPPLPSRLFSLPLLKGFRSSAYNVSKKKWNCFIFIFLIQMKST